MATIAGTVLWASLLGSCGQSGPGPEHATQRCAVETTPIAAVQGSGVTSAMLGSEVIVRGIITRVEPGTGLYIEEPASDTFPESSNAIFIDDPILSREGRTGQMIIISGKVSELGKGADPLTALTGASGHQLCASGIELPLTPAKLPLNPGQREAVESMRISLDQKLTVSDVYHLHRGEVILDGRGISRVFTEDHPPGPASVTAQKNRQEWSLRTASFEPALPVLSRGTTVVHATGVMSNDGRGRILLLEQTLASRPQDSPPLPDRKENTIRVSSFNLLNFFNGDGRGGGFPTERGAKTYDDFLAQANRIRLAIAIMEPHLLAVQELENDGFGPHSAARSLVELLNESGHGSWAAIEPSSARIGEDVITVGLFYRTDILAPAGPAHILDSAPFQKISRQPLAQLFQDHSTGQRFLVAVNHLKSKGSCPKTGRNSDQHDGQGCWNPARVAAAKAMTGWVSDLAVKSETERILILGDLNAWRNEDPIRIFRDQGFTELVEQFAGLPQHSYVYQGEAGTLDYAFASDALIPSVSHADIWHINSGWPQKMKLPDPWLRSSDHDPVVVDLDFSQPDTSD